MSPNLNKATLTGLCALTLTGIIDPSLPETLSTNLYYAGFKEH